jgi:periplasmic copper chaperone A
MIHRRGSLWGGALLAAIWLGSPLWAAPPAVEVTHAWVRATVPGQPVAGAYLTIQSARAAKLVAVSSPVAASAEMHSMSGAGGVMRMRKLEALALPAGKPVELKSGGDHIMLLEIKHQLRPGDKVPITLTIEQGGSRKAVAIEAEVREAQ